MTNSDLRYYKSLFVKVSSPSLLLLFDNTHFDRIVEHTQVGVVVGAIPYVISLSISQNFQLIDQSATGKVKNIDIDVLINVGIISRQF